MFWVWLLGEYSKVGYKYSKVGYKHSKVGYCIQKLDTVFKILIVKNVLKTILYIIKK